MSTIAPTATSATSDAPATFAAPGDSFGNFFCIDILLRLRALRGRFGETGSRGSKGDAPDNSEISVRNSSQGCWLGGRRRSQNRHVAKSDNANCDPSYQPAAWPSFLKSEAPR